MAGEVKEFMADFGKSMEQMKAQMPDMVSGFGGLFGKVMKDGALPVKQKELIALGIAVVQRCRPCIYMHTQKCLQAGLKREEILEAAGVAVMMQGGPAYTHVPVVMKALDELEEK